ncbi:MAG TPA: cytochrome c oxidase accessory protein CcoG [Rhodospirillaceae bacterium]|nr:cytochrome c oxidase accessory protein CcoG [Rhodospirillaceae bacterium]
MSMQTPVTSPAETTGGALYAETRKAYPRFLNKGLYRRLKWLALIVSLGVYWIVPWLRWDRGPGAPDQAILIDMPGRRAYFLFIEIWPQEVYYLTGILIIAALSLFFISALLGRVWCGFACWQTVFTDLMVWIERLFEGERAQRILRDRAPWSVDKLWRKAAKQVCWIIVSVLAGYGFVGYFDDVHSLTRDLLAGQASFTELAAMAVVGGCCYLLAGFAREDVCIYMCPYSRFQSAMFDEHSMIVSYEAWRGEPRGHVKGSGRGKVAADSFAGRGHCVDCRLCVQVCPTGIDIRDGSQLACIGCALCVDACNSVMDRVGLPRGLISYDSVYNQQARSKGDMTTRTKIARPRVFLYLGVIGLVAVVMLYALATRKTYDVNVLHERSPVFVEISGDRIRNGYTLKILNMVREEGHFRLAVEPLAGAGITVIGGEGEQMQSVDLTVAGDSVGTFRLFVTAPRASIGGRKSDLVFTVTNRDTGKVVRRENLFAGPES